MSKYVVLSFDDGRQDQYLVAFSILQKYNLPATINVVSEFINNDSNFSCFKTMDNKSLSWDNLLEMEKNGGWEIACHGATHENSKEDIELWMKEKRIEDNNWNIDVGFASPTSFLTYNNSREIFDLVEQGKLLYIRSGKRVRDMGITYAIKSLLNRYLKSKSLFINLNKDSIINSCEKKDLLMSVPITCYETKDEVISLIERVQNNQAIILMFHSIINDDDLREAKDKWYWNAVKLEGLARYLVNEKDIEVVTNRELVKRMRKV